MQTEMLKIVDSASATTNATRASKSNTFFISRIVEYRELAQWQCENFHLTGCGLIISSAYDPLRTVGVVRQTEFIRWYGTASFPVSQTDPSSSRP